jgi:hypothetical protein
MTGKHPPDELNYAYLPQLVRDRNSSLKATAMSIQCNKCNCDMEEGFLLEKGDGGVLSSATWVTGNPEKSLLFGLSVKGKPIYTVKTFRCTGCGYLESYALGRL